LPDASPQESEARRREPLFVEQERLLRIGMEQDASGKACISQMMLLPEDKSETPNRRQSWVAAAVATVTP
jgi:hypothetical protein